MVSAKRFVDEDGKQRIAAAIAEAEKQTAAEIVCAVATESGRYDRAEAVVGIIVAVVALWGAHIGGQSWEFGEWDAGGLHIGWQVLAVILGFVSGNVAASFVHGIRRLAASGREMRQEVDRAASHVFATHRLGATRDAGGVLIYVSLFERRVAVVADKGVLDKLGQTFVDELRDTALTQLRDGKTADVYIATVGAAAPRLAEALPVAADDTDELSNALITIHPRP